MKLRKIYYAFILLGLISCNNDDSWTDNTPITPEDGTVQGLYILNEGSWGGNNAELSYYDYASGNFTEDYFNSVNPSQGGLGDVGNDLKVYGSKLYAVINSSNYVEVMEAKTAKHIAKIQIANCRSLTFDKGFAYVTSYAGTIDDLGKQLGFVAKIDTASLSIVDRVSVEYQPEELTISNNKLYVANSGGYNYPNYSDKVSIINLSTFKVINTLAVGVPNLSKIKTDKNGDVWVVSQGDYNGITPALSVIDPKTDQVIEKLENINIKDFTFYGNDLYFYGSTYSMDTGNYLNSYGVIDINSKTQTASHIFNSSLESQITAPYGLIINPENGDIFLSAALDYFSRGKVYCFDKNGSQKWVKTTGINPGHFALLYK